MNIAKSCLATSIMPVKLVSDAHSAAPDMTREKLIEVVQWIALSHEQLRAELEGAEAMIGCPHCGQHCDLMGK
jgi:hypothetical protein